MSSVTYLLDHLNLKSLQSRRSVSRLTLLYKVLHQDLPSLVLHQDLPSIQPPLHYKPTVYPTRLLHQYRYISPTTKTTVYQQSYFPRTIKQWNNPPNSVIEAETLRITSTQKNLEFSTRVGKFSTRVGTIAH